MNNQRDVEYMAYAVQLAKHGKCTTRPNPNVGCVIVNAQGEIVGEGYHQRAGEAHAEIHALQQAKEKANGAIAYVTLEPCNHAGKTGPCIQALLNAGIKRVVVGAQDPNPIAGGGIQKLREHNVEVDTGVLATQCKSLNRGFHKRMGTGLPWLTVKSAMSLDGRTGLSNGISKWISGAAARNDVQRLRAEHDVVMTGIGTVLADDPSLNVRLSSEELNITGEVLQPTRVIIDTELKCPASAKLMQLKGEVIIYTCMDAAKYPVIQNCQVVQVKENNGKVCMVSVLKDLAQKEVNSVLVEAGSQLLGTLYKQKLVDELIVYVAPKFLGSSAQGLVEIGDLIAMDEQITLEYNDIRTIGSDIKITAAIKN